MIEVFSITGRIDLIDLDRGEGLNAHLPKSKGKEALTVNRLRTEDLFEDGFGFRMPAFKVFVVSIKTCQGFRPIQLVPDRINRIPFRHFSTFSLEATGMKPQG